MLNQAKKKIGALIAAGYALALVLMVALGLLAVSGMDTLKSITLDIYAHPFKVTNAALEAKASMVQARNRTLLIVLFDDPKKIEQWSAEIAIFDKDAKEQLDSMKTNFIGDIQRVEEAETLLKQWQGIRNHAIELSLGGQRDEATHLIMEASLGLFSRLTESLDHVIGSARQKAASYVDESEKKAVAERNRMVWFLICLVAVISLIGWEVKRKVMVMVRRVEQLERDLLLSQYQAENAAYARSLIEASLDPLVTISPEGKITDVNRATEQVTGASRDGLIGTDFAEYFTEPGKAHEGYRTVFAEGVVVDYPLSIRHRDGRITEVLYNASLYRDESGKVLGVFAAARDVTKQNALAKEKEQYFRFFMLMAKEKEESQTRNAAYVRSLIEASLDPLVTISPEGKITDVNRATEQVTGSSREELVGTDFAEYFTEPGKAHEGYRKVFSEGSVIDYPLAIRHREGRITEVLYNASLYRDESGNALGVFAAARDVTERNRLATEREQYFRFFTLSIDPMCIADPYGCFKRVNPALVRLTGYAESELLDRPFLEFVLPEDRQKTQEEVKLQVNVRPTFHFENRYLCKDGKVIFLSWTAYFDKNDGVTYATAHDHTEFHAAEEALREKEERLALATLKNGVGVWDWNLQTQELIWDASMYELYHIRREDFPGTEEAWRAALHPDDLERGDREVEDAIAGRKPFETEFRVVWPNGEIHHIKAVAKVFRDGEGTPVRMLGINMDVTDRKQAEEKIHQINAELEQRVMDRTAQLEAANKELEAFSYSVSHDLRTPLRAIDGFSLILLEDYADTLDEEGKRLLNVVRNNTARMSQLIDDILRFSRAGRTEMSFSEIDMEGMVRDVLDELKPLMADRNVQIRLGSLPGAMGDRAMLRQVIGNLLSNAIKFSSKKEDASIDIGGSIEDGNVVYHVKDNGVGFDMRYAGKLFGVFQRLHGVDEFEGTGIGLAIVKRVIARHGGRVWAESEIGKGAAFYFSIPLKEC